MIYESVTRLIGKTPLLRLRGLEEKFRLKAELVAKLNISIPLAA